MPVKKTSTAKRTTTAKKTAAAKRSTTRATSATTAKPRTRTPARAARVKRGDLILIDAQKVGSPPREGEVLQVIHRDLVVSYRVRWADGAETLISPAPGSARFVPA